MATKNTILGTVPKSRGRYQEGDTTTKWYYDNILEYKGSSFRCISKASTGITGAPAIYDANTHTLVPKSGWEFFVDTTGALDVEERLTENEKNIFELGKYSDNSEYARVIVDNDGKLLAWIDTKGNVGWTKGVPEPILQYVKSIESVLRNEQREIQEIIDNPEYIYLKIDKDGKIIESVDKNGKHFFGTELSFNKSIFVNGTVSDVFNNVSITNSPEYIEIKTDNEGKLIDALKNDGTRLINGKVVFGNGVPQQIKEEIESAHANSFKLYNSVSQLPFSLKNNRWSGMIPLAGTTEIIFNLRPKNGYVQLFFYKNDESHYIGTDGNHDISKADVKYPLTTLDVVSGTIKVPTGLKYCSFFLSAKDEFVLFDRRNGSNNNSNYKIIQDVIKGSVSISDGFLPACGEPNLLYDPIKGIVYENYMCGDTFDGDPGGNFGFAKFPLAQPERAKYYVPISWNKTLVDDGYSVRFRDTLWYWKEKYSLIRCITYGVSNKTGVYSLYYFDMDTDGNVSNVTEIKYNDGNSVNYNNTIQQIIGLGLTPYYTADPSAHESNVYKLLLPSSSHVQEHDGYKYFTLNLTGECPLICRTNNDFDTIEAVHGFQKKAYYEAALVIKNNDWYYAVRTGLGIEYTQSEDFEHWSEFTTITNSIGSKPRGIMFGDKIAFLIPLSKLDAFPTAQNEDGETLFESRVAAEIIVGDKSENINNWEKKIVLISKYGQNYGDIFTVGKDIYYAYSCDKSHIWSIPSIGKSQIMFVNLGNPDNINLFGDY